MVRVCRPLGVGLKGAESWLCVELVWAPGLLWGFEEGLASRRRGAGQEECFTVFSGDCGYSSLASSGVAEGGGAVGSETMSVTFSYSLALKPLHL